jgi:hypothetical protein
MRNDKLYAAIVDVLREFGEVRHISSIAHELELAIVSAQSLASPKVAENDPDRAVDCEQAVYEDFAGCGGGLERKRGNIDNHRDRQKPPDQP